MNNGTEISSPCIGNCCLGPADICLGCFRSIDEILVWGSAASNERLLIIEKALIRRSKQE